MRFTTPLIVAPVVALCCAGAMAAGQNCPGTGCIISTCQQSMLQGNWEIFISNRVGASVFVCPITIAATGSFASPSSCVDDYAYSNRPSGNLTIDSLCHVTGSLSFSLAGGSGFSFVYNAISLWISADESRVSGYGSGTETFSGATYPFHGVPLRLVYRTAGQ